MRVEEFNYNLPEELIAQTPLEKRDASRLLVLDKKTGEIEHKKFTDIINYLEPGDTLVLNDTKVLPARLIGEKEETKAVIEILLLKNTIGDEWECLVKPARRIKVGTIVTFGNGKLKAQCIEEKEDGLRQFRLIYDGILLEILEELGTMPLPPYIHEKLEDQSRYQTVYAKEVGSAAAPTAGLHFTKELLKKIEDKGVNIAYVTLHVGLGTFRPVSVETIEEHEMHSEYYSMTKEDADILNKTKKEGKRIISVGTTSTRTLETIMTKYNEFKDIAINSIYLDDDLLEKEIDSVLGKNTFKKVCKKLENLNNMILLNNKFNNSYDLSIEYVSIRNDFINRYISKKYIEVI